ncbi:MAG TPA: hypothetical protein VG406_24230 [Isosphaeraceae bacterium]|jgi:hypothetical protein|nr:hypothetical protein [Isosphaeraceae bacterium]
MLSKLIALAKKCAQLDVSDDGDATPGPDAMMEAGDDVEVDEALDAGDAIEADPDMLAAVDDDDAGEFDADDQEADEEDDLIDVEDEDGDPLHPRKGDGTLPPISDRDGLLSAGHKLPPTITLRTAIAGKGVKPQVDRAGNGAIRNVAVMQAGSAKGHGFDIDRKMLGQAEASMQGGVAMRFKHPQRLNADGSSEIVDPLGTHVGKVTNVRMSPAGDEIRGDIEFGKHAKNVPGHGDVATYLMDLAEEDPTAFGLSTVYRPAAYERGPDGRPLGRVDQVQACDLTGDPASTRQGLL